MSRMDTSTTTLIRRNPYIKRKRFNKPSLVRSYATRRRYGKQMRNLPDETKYVDGYLDSIAIHALSGSIDDTWADTELNPRQQTAVYGCMPVPRQGDNYGDRDGRRVKYKKLIIKGYIYWNGLDSDTPPTQQGHVRIVIVRDKRTNGVALAGENVIGAGLGSDGQNTLSGDAGAINFCTNPDGWGRYKVLYDKVFRPPTSAAYGDFDANAGNLVATVTPFKISLKTNFYVNFCETSGTVAAVVDNSIHLLAAQLSGDQVANLCYYARQSFIG
jgi:hypothetical protein